MAKNNDKTNAKTKSCPVKAILQDKVDPKQIPLEAIHASSVRMMTNFVQHPSPELANGVIRMLDAIAQHEESFKTGTGASVYTQASFVWRGIVETMLALDLERSPHVLH